MSTFVQKYNPLKGVNEWNLTVENYDYRQEIARSGYADMLHDDERNQLYQKAIVKCVQSLLKKTPANQVIRVVDIGAGTGLLSMMAAKAFGDQIHRASITAYECFPPMGDCAEKIIAKNGYSNVIKVVKKRSTEEEMEEKLKGDLLVTEVFDTELIGEGALETFRFALKKQLKANSLIVPTKSRVWIQLVTSDFLERSNQFTEMSTEQVNQIKIPQNVLACPGSNQLHDLQLSQLKLGKDLRLVSEPKVLFEFDFTNMDTLKLNDMKTVEFIITEEVVLMPLMIAMWWDLDMDPDGEFLLSCAPHWAHPLKRKEVLPWRDHWMQAVYYLPANTKPFILEPDDVVSINGFHDEYSLWFDLASTSSKKDSNSSHSAPLCTCGLHSHMSRARLRMINDEEKLKTYLSALTKVNPKKIVYVGDAGSLPLLIAKTMDTEHLICVTDGKKVNQIFYEEFSKANRIENLSIVEQLEDIDNINEVDTIIAEPYHGAVSLPWDCLNFFYRISDLSKQGSLNHQINIFPYKIILKVLAVEFDHLWKIRSKLQSVCGFDISQFDDLTLSASSEVDPIVEPQPLWEYPCKSLMEEPLTVFEWTHSDFNCSKQLECFHGKLNIPNNIRRANLPMSLVLWVDFVLNDKQYLTTGTTKVLVEQYVDWVREWNQGVVLNVEDKPDLSKEKTEITFKLTYNYTNGDIEFLKLKLT